MCLGVVLKLRRKKNLKNRRKPTFHTHETNIMINDRLIRNHGGQKSAEGHIILQEKWFQREAW